MRSPANSGTAGGLSASWGARPRGRPCSTGRLAATSADGRSSMPPRPYCRDLPRPPSSCSRRDFFKLFHRVWRESTKRRLFSKPSFLRGVQRFPSPILGNFNRNRAGGERRGGAAGGGGASAKVRGGWGATGD